MTLMIQMNVKCTNPMTIKNNILLNTLLSPLFLTVGEHKVCCVRLKVLSIQLLVCTTKWSYKLIYIPLNLESVYLQNDTKSTVM